MESSHREGLLDIFRFIGNLGLFDFLAILGFFLLAAAATVLEATFFSAFWAVAVLEAAFFCTFGCSCRGNNNKGEEKDVLAG